MNLNSEINKVMSIGKRNLEIEALFSSWCSHSRVEHNENGGVGLIEQMYGLPVGLLGVRCNFAHKPSNTFGMDVEPLALEFYKTNCIGCLHRNGLRIPNISTLYSKHEEERKEEERKLDVAQKSSQVALSLRKDKRATHRNPADSMREEIIDLIDAVDALSPGEVSEKLTLMAEKAPTRFDAHIVDMLFELVNIGPTLRSDAGLKALNHVAGSDSRLVPATLRTMACGNSLIEGGAIIERHLSPKDATELKGAVWGLITLASPSRTPFFEGTITLRPGPLIKAYQMCPSVVLEETKALLKEMSKDVRSATARAIERLMEVDENIIDAIVTPLLESIGLPDDPYEDGTASGHATDALATAMLHKPSLVDATIQDFLKRTDTEISKEIFAVYDSIIRRELRTGAKVPQEAINLAVQRTLEVILTPKSPLLREAIEVLDLATKYAPTSLIGRETLLLGAAILIETELRKPKVSPLIDPNWNQLRGLEASSQRMLLNHVLNSLGDAVQALASEKPEKLFNEFKDTFTTVKDREDAVSFRTIIVRGFLGVALNSAWLGHALHYIYTAMHDVSVSVRAAAAEAYGELLEHYGHDLPVLLHETFALLLTDSYKAVHMAALHAIRHKDLPDCIRPRVFKAVVFLCKCYMNEDNDDFLSECLFELTRRAKDSGIEEASLAPFILNAIQKMKSSQAIETLDRLNLSSIYEHPSYLDIFTRILKDHASFRHREDEIVQLVAAIPPQSIPELAETIADAGVVAYKHHQGHLALSLIERLCSANQLAIAHKAIIEIKELIPDTIEKTNPRLEMDLREIAFRIELACQNGDSNTALTHAETWKLTVEKINDTE